MAVAFFEILAVTLLDYVHDAVSVGFQEELVCVLFFHEIRKGNRAKSKCLEICGQNLQG
jgi:hypothetical protein